MAGLAHVHRDLRFQVGVVFVVFILVIVSFTHSGARSDSLSYEEINNILSGSDSGSDIEQVQLDHMSLHVPFFEDGLKSKDWELNGDVFIKNNDYIRLTMERKDQAGMIFSKHSFDDAGFEIDFRFAIHGTAKTNGLKGDGMAMFLTDKKLGMGTVFGAEDKFNGIGLFFDTYRNARKGRVFPYITVMNGDGRTPYDKNNDGKANELGGCTARNIYNTKQGFVDARLIHTVDDGYLSLDYNVNGNWVNCFSIQDVYIPEERYLGFSAATGDLVENVDLMDVRLFKLEHHGEPVTSFEKFISQETAEEKEAEEAKKQKVTYKEKRMRKSRNDRQRNKLRAKLRNKQRRLEARMTSNAEDEGFQFFSTLWWLIKKAVITMVFLFFCYVAFTVYRVKKRTWNKKRHTGLLD